MDMEKKSGRNNSLELVRMFAALMILLHHIDQFFWGGDVFSGILALYVELFFMITGFFLMVHMDKEESAGESSWDYLLHKIKGFFAPLCIANAVHLLLFCLMNHVDSVKGVFDTIYHFKWEFILLQCAGFLQAPQFNSDYLIGATWYISAMMLALVFAFPLVKHWRKGYVYILCPLSIIYVYSGAVQHYGDIDIGNGFMNMLSDAIIRGFAGIAAGVLCYEAYRFLEKKDIFHKSYWQVLDILSWLMLPGSVVMAYFGVSDSDFFILIPFGVVIISAIKGVSIMPRALSRIPSGAALFLGRFSFYVYLTQFTAIFFVMTYCSMLDVTLQILVVLGIIIVYSLLLYFFEKKRKHVYPVVIACAVPIIACIVNALIV